MKKENHAKSKDLNGFTLSEVLITMALFLVLASLGVGSYFQYYTFSLINNEVNNINSTLHETRFKALKNPYNSNYGIHLNMGTGEITSFRDTYTPSDPENIMIQLDQLNISTLNLQPTPGTTNEIIFDNITGKTQNSGSFTVGNSNFTFDFNINLQGGFE